MSVRAVASAAAVAKMPPIRARARPLGASAEGAWGPAAEDVICGSVRSSGAKMRALAL
jgi:hypothetical protein